MIVRAVCDTGEVLCKGNAHEALGDPSSFHITICHETGAPALPPRGLLVRATDGLLVVAYENTRVAVRVLAGEILVASHPRDQVAHVSRNCKALLTYPRLEPIHRADLQIHDVPPSQLRGLLRKRHLRPRHTLRRGGGRYARRARHSGGIRIVRKHLGGWALWGSAEGTVCATPGEAILQALSHLGIASSNGLQGWHPSAWYTL